MSEVKIIYTEPADYFPKELREKFFREMEDKAEKNDENEEIMRNENNNQNRLDS